MLALILSLLRVSASAGLAALLMVAGTSASAQTPTQENFGDWSKTCATGESGGQECFIFQNINAEKTGKRILHLTVVKVPDVPRPIMIFTVPLGVLLPPGLEVVIDGQPAGRVQIQICSESGCQSQIQFSEELLVKFRAGLKGAVNLIDPSGKTVTVPFSLKGFTKALNSL